MELARSEKAVRYLEALKRMQVQLPQLQRAHRQKAGADIIRLAPDILTLDSRLGYSKGVLRPTIRRYYADGLYLKGLEAYTDGELIKSSTLFRKAIKMQKDHKLSKSYLQTLSRKARVLYYEAYVLKDSDAAEAARIFERVTKITPKDNQFHKLSRKWLKTNRR